MLFLNNDTLLTPDWLPPLFQAFADEDRLGAAGPLLLYADNTVQHLGVTFSTSGVFHLYRGLPKDHPVVPKKRKFQALTGAALMLPKTLFFEAGCFYEEYKNGFEDVDLCLQIYKRGKVLRCIAESSVFHLESQTPGRKNHEQHNSDLFIERCADLFHIDLHLHGWRDGLKPVVGDLLSIHLVTGETRDLELRRQFEACAPGQRQALLAQHPFWIWGHERLAELLYEARHYAESCYFLATALDKFASLEGFKKLLFQARQTEQTALVELAEKNLQKIRTLYENNQIKFTTIINKLLHKADQGNDKLLRRLLEEKIAEVKNRPELAGEATSPADSAPAVNRGRA